MTNPYSEIPERSNGQTITSSWFNTIRTKLIDNTEYNFTSKTAAYTATTSDRIISCDSSSGAFTITLYAASGNAGRRLIFIKTNPEAISITIDGNASETINGNTTTTIDTQYERLEIVCDGTNWLIIKRECNTGWINFPSTAAGTLITSTGTNPTYGTTSNNIARWRRIGSNMNIEWDFVQSTAGTQGTGAYLFNIPPGFTIDTTNKPVNTSVTIADSTLDINSVVGDMSFLWAQGSIDFFGQGKGVVYSTTQIKCPHSYIASNQDLNYFFWGTSFGFNSSPLSISASFSVPISGWKGEQE